MEKVTLNSAEIEINREAEDLEAYLGLTREAAEKAVVKLVESNKADDAVADAIEIANQDPKLLIFLATIGLMNVYKHSQKRVFLKKLLEEIL